MSMLMYLVMRCAAGQPHHVRRLVLMSPAGYHNTVPAAFWPFIMVLPWWHKLLVLLVGRHRACEWCGVFCGCSLLMFRLHMR
jgi:pimeloyl-ACP methyl ester carboxylesterase